MARKLENKTNVVAPGGSYPYGRIKDDTGSNDGTPVNEAVYGDFHQFFEKLMADGNVVHNGQPENATNGFQFIQALYAAVRKLDADYLNKGVSQFESILSMLTLSASSAEFKAVSPRALFLTNGLMHTESRLTTKVVNIGNWDIMNTASVNVAHGLADFKKIRDVSVVIRNDNDSIYFKATDRLGGLEISQINSTIITLNKIGAAFSSSDFDTATSYNRGFITITYAD